MKLRFLGLVIAVATSSLLSCSGDDDKNNEPVTSQENELRIKKVTQITHFGSMPSETSVSDFIYDETQNLVRIITLTPTYTYASEFHYDGLKVDHVEYFQNGASDGLTTLYYEGDVLKYTLSGTEQDERSNYTYNGDNIASLKTYYPDGLNAELLESRMYKYANGNVSKVSINSYFFGTSAYRIEYAYDGKNNPLKTMNKYLRLTLRNEGFDGLSVSNPISRKVYNPVDEASPEQFYYEMSYNSDNYPIVIKRFSSENNILYSETIIEYQ